MTWLLMALSGIRKAFSALLGVVVRYPWQAALVAALALCWWQWSGKREALSERDAARAQTAEIIKASEEAERLAIAARKAQEARYKDLANAIDKEHESALADATSAAARYVSLHQVGKCSTGQTAPASQDHSAESGERSGSEAVMVAVSEADIHICTQNTTRLESVRDWALTLNP